MADGTFETAVAHFGRGDYENAISSCTEVLAAPGVSGAYRLRVIRLLLCTSELWWRDNAEAERLVGARALIDEADRIAESIGTLADLAISSYLRGITLVTIDSLDRSVAALKRAVDLARQAGDQFTEVASLTKLGHYEVGRSLERGRVLLYEARGALARSTGGIRYPEDGLMLEAVRAQLTGYVGVAEFDAGEFDPAESHIRESLSRTVAIDARAIMANYLGQLLTAEGRFEEAEKVLLAALTPLAAEARSSMHQGYNQVQLGKLYLEWGRPDVAEEPMFNGWRQVQASGNVSVLPIARNFLAELLMHAAYDGRDLPGAAELLSETVTECEHTGFKRSKIGALALGARVAQMRGDLTNALDLSDRAVRELAEAGIMPALRTEEVYLVRHDVLAAADQHDEASQWRSRALAELDRKAASIADPAHRVVFRERVATSRAILDLARTWERAPRF